LSDVLINEYLFIIYLSSISSTSLTNNGRRCAKFRHILCITRQVYFHFAALYPGNVTYRRLYNSVHKLFKKLHEAANKRHSITQCALSLHKKHYRPGLRPTNLVGNGKHFRYATLWAPLGVVSCPALHKILATPLVDNNSPSQHFDPSKQLGIVLRLVSPRATKDTIALKKWRKAASITLDHEQAWDKEFNVVTR